MKKYIMIIPVFFITLTASCYQYMDDLALQVKLNEGLIAYWPVVEGSGNRVKDYSGGNRDIVFTGSISYASGKYSNAMNLTGAISGSSSGIDLYDSAPVTVSFWMNPQNNVSKNIALTDLRSFIIEQVNQSIVFYIATEEVYAKTITVSNCITYNAWQYFSVTYDGSFACFYVNGELKLKEAYTTTMDGCDDVAFNNSGWVGLLDEIRIYNRVLSQEEIKALMDIGI
jgi:hypothetical protein